MEFRLLGHLEVRDGRGAVRLGRPRQRLVLAHLVLRANRLVPAERLIDEVWGEQPPAAVRSSLQAYVSRLRAVLGADRIEGRSGGYLLHADPSDIDAVRFEQLVGQARRLAVTDPAEAVGLYGDALGLWRGDALDDLAEHPSLRPEIARLEGLRLGALEDRFDAELALGRHAEVVPELEAVTARNPLRERLWGQLIVARYRCGGQADALAAFRRLRRTLARDLGVDPSPELQRLHRQVLRHDRALERAGVPLRGYRLLERLGAGSSGVVHRAVQPHVDREVAVKVIHPQLANDPRFIRRFEAEAQLVARLEHPHLVPLYDYWRDPDGAYLVMRYLRGGSLRDRLADGPLDVEAARQVVEQVGLALQVAHREGVVHRDVKPENILFDEDGNAYLADFGIAMDLAAAPATSRRTSASRSGSYRSPEEIRGKASTPQADIYRLGLVVHEMLAGRHPFADTPAERLPDAHLRAPVPHLHGPRAEIPAPVDRVIERATAKHPDDRYADVTELALEFGRALAGTTAPPAPVPDAEVVNPYKGLRAFTAADAADFFGRETATDRLLDRLRGTGEWSRFVAVVGPSGSGKSSLVRAGLIPALRRGHLDGSDRWFVVEMHPGQRPFEELAASLTRVAVDPPTDLAERLEGDDVALWRTVEQLLPAGAELLLVIDQFEELFTLVDDDITRARFLRLLCTAVRSRGGRVRCVVTLRADFYDRPLSYQPFGELLAEHTHALAPLSAEELERAVRCPAERVGVGLEPALVADVVADVARRPGAPPLLQYAMTVLFDRSRDAVLTVDGYREIGGVSGALARRAEDLYDGLDDAARHAARQLFLRLVTVGDEGRDDTRRQVPRAELTTLEVEPTAMEVAIDRFGGGRLLSFDRDRVTRSPTVEVAHEALLREWGRLHGWIESAREDMRTRRRLAVAAREWADAGRDPGFLLRGAQLARFDGWAGASRLALTGDEREYLQASRVQRDAELAAEGARAERERRLERRSLWRLRALVAALAAFGLVASMLTVASLAQRQRAEQAARETAARELAAASALALGEDPERAILLALEAVAVSRRAGEPPPGAVAILHQATQSSRLERRLDDGHWVADVSPDGRWLVTTSFDTGTGEAGEDVIIWHAGTGERQATLAGDAQVRDFRFDPDGRYLAVAHKDPDGASRVVLWDPTTLRQVRVHDIPGRIPRGGIWLAWSPDGRWLAASAVDEVDLEQPLQTVSVWDVHGGGEPSSFRVRARPWTMGVLEEGTVLVAGSDDLRSDEVGVYDPAAGELVDRLHLPGLEADRLLVDRARNRLLAADPQALGAWDLGTGEPLWLRSEPGLIWVRVDPDSGVIATTRDDGRIRLLDPDDGSARTTVFGATGQVLGLALYPGAQRVAGSGYGETLVWDVGPAGPDAAGAIDLGPADPFSVAVSPDGGEVGVGSAGGFQRFDAVTGAPLGRRLESDEIDRSSPAPTSGDWRLVAAVDASEQAWVRDLTTGAPATRLPSCAAPRAFSEDGAALVLDGRSRCDPGETNADVDLRSRVVDPRTGDELLDLGQRPVLPAPGAAAFNPSGDLDPGRYLAVAISEGRTAGLVEIHDLAAGRLVTTLRREADAPSTVAFDPTGRYLAGGTRNGRAWVLDLAAVVDGAHATDALTFDRAVDSGTVTTVALSADGMLATSAFGSLRLWDVHTGRLTVDLAVDAGLPPAATFSPAGDTVYYVDAVPGGFLLRRFPLDLDELVALAERRLTRSLTEDECRRYPYAERCAGNLEPSG